MAGRERENTVELVAHLSSLDKRPAVYAVEPLPAQPPVVMASETAPPVAVPAAPRPIVRPTAPERYRIQFTIGERTHHKLRRLQALLRREIPDGDPAVIFDRALTLLLEKVEKTKLGMAITPQKGPVIRPGTDKSRAVPRAVKRGAWKRDAGHLRTSEHLLERQRVQRPAPRSMIGLTLIRGARGAALVASLPGPVLTAGTAAAPSQ